MKPYYEASGITIFHGDCREILPQLTADVIISDPPYSERTHRGHDASASGHIGEGKDNANRSGLGYGWLTESDVVDYVDRAIHACSGWIVTFTDHTLAPLFARELEAAGRYVFAPLPLYSPGRSVRLSGDGPSSWTDWIIVARTAKQSRWGTLPGGYVSTSDRWHMGGKPLAAMKAIVRDYSREQDLILDPFMGSGTTLSAAKELGRCAIGIEIKEENCEIAAKRLSQEVFNFIPAS